MPIFALPTDRKDFEFLETFTVKTANTLADYQYRFFDNCDRNFSGYLRDTSGYDLTFYSHLGAWTYAGESANQWRVTGAAGYGSFDVVREYDWQVRLAALRSWTRDPYHSTSTPISEFALHTAESIAAYAEKRIRSIRAVLTTIVAPGDGTGVHIEWTARSDRVSHLELSISAVRRDRFELLRTEETLSGRVLSAREVADATLSEVIASFEHVLAKAPRTPW